MAIKNKPRKKSKRKVSLVRLGLRVEAEEARRIRKAARNQGQSTNHWMSTHLVALATQELRARAGTTVAERMQQASVQEGK